MKELIIIGHKNPDTDSIVASLVFGNFLKKNKLLPIPLSNFKIKVGYSGILNKEVVFVLNYFKEKKPSLIKSLKGKNVFLIDHGDYEQSIEGVEEANIVGVLDHHKLGGIKTQAPIFYRAEPLGSTSTILAKMFFENATPLTKKEAGLLLTGIISDTLKFTSPTTTKEDKDIAYVLAEISKEDITKLSKKMFEAKSDISDISPDKLVTMDYKEFKTKGIKFAIGVHETVLPEKIFSIKGKIFQALERLKKKRKQKLMFFVVIDILKKNGTLFLLSEKETKIAKKVFGKQVKDNLMLLPGVVSRKKQILPKILKFLEENESIS